MKSVWKGSISFGLVSIPVQLFTAHETEALGFHLLHDKCLTRLEYRRWCPHCKKDVAWDDTVKGIKKTNGSYLALTQEMIKELHPEKTEEISVVEFVDSDAIPIIYLNHHYYVVPLKPKEIAYSLFIKALQRAGKVAIGRFVMRNKEYTCAIQPHEDYLVLTTLFYAYEVRGLQKAAYKEKIAVKPVELKLATEMIEKLSVKTFNIEQFKDTFAQKIKQLLKEKSKKGKSKRVTKVEKPKTKIKPSLVDSLRGSIEHIKSHGAYAKKRG